MSAHEPIDWSGEGPKASALTEDVRVNVINLVLQVARDKFQSQNLDKIVTGMAVLREDGVITGATIFYREA